MQDMFQTQSALQARWNCFKHDYDEWSKIMLFKQFTYTLDSGIDVPPWINVAPLLKDFNIRILIHFYIKQGIVVIFHFFSFNFFLKN